MRYVKFESLLHIMALLVRKYALFIKFWLCMLIFDLHDEMLVI